MDDKEMLDVFFRAAILIGEANIKGGSDLGLIMACRNAADAIQSRLDILRNENERLKRGSKYVGKSHGEQSVREKYFGKRVLWRYWTETRVQEGQIVEISPSEIFLKVKEADGGEFWVEVAKFNLVEFLKDEAEPIIYSGGRVMT
jgi:hypothetical protein